MQSVTLGKTSSANPRIHTSSGISGLDDFVEYALSESLCAKVADTYSRTYNSKRTETYGFDPSVFADSVSNASISLTRLPLGIVGFSAKVTSQTGGYTTKVHGLAQRNLGVSCILPAYSRKI